MTDSNQADLARAALELLGDKTLRPLFASVEPTQLRTLHAAFEQAGSLEEQEIVLRYQAARLRDKWDPKLVEKLLALFRKAGKEVAGAGAGPERQAKAAAQQMGLIVRAHRIAYEERKGGEKKGGGR